LRESDYDAAKSGFAVRFVTIGSQEKAEEFCGRQDFATLCIGDETKASYRAMGLEDFNLLKLFTDPALKARRKENAAAGFSQDWRATKISDGAQLPGAAIVDANGKIPWIYRGAHPGDLPPMAEMLERATKSLGSDS
jgi:hypothetical protein